MEENKALSKLSDATDLLLLLEEILNPASIERISQASWSGVRLTLRNARVTLQESQNALSKDFVARSRNSQSINASSAANVATEGISAKGSTVSNNVGYPLLDQELGADTLSSSPGFDKQVSEPAQVQITRRDLKTTLERFIETR